MNPLQNAPSAFIEAEFVDPETVAQYYSPEVKLALERLHPEVTVRWNVRSRRWWLVQTTRLGRLHPFRCIGTQNIGEEPTIENTVVFVSKLARLRSKLERDKWLAEVDATDGGGEIERDARERLRAGARDLYPRLFANRIIVPRVGGIVHAPTRAERRRRR